MNELKQLAEYISRFNIEEVPKSVREEAEKCILDTVGLALGAAGDEMISSIKQQYLNIDGFGTITLWGDNRKAPLRTAVFINAMMAHLLELDDVHVQSKTHIGTVVIPTAWGLAEYMGKSGKDLVEAVICGYETMSRIGMGFGVSSHRGKGWHVTGTAGTFGAAAACAKLMGFTAEQTLAAFGLAGTQSCSTWAFLSDGATNKILHPGRAAVSGLEACLLVEGGMRGSANILSSEDGGLFPMMSDSYDYKKVSEGLGDVYEILYMDRKPYPCCRSTHCAIDGALLLKNEYAIRPEKVVSVVVKTYKIGWQQCGLSPTSIEPHLPSQAKFSTPFTVACALVDGTVGLDSFTSENIERPEIRALMKKVTVQEDLSYTEKYPKQWGCEIEIRLNGEEILSKVIPNASGSVDAPLSVEQLKNKVITSCLTYSTVWISSLIEDLLHLDAENNTLPNLANTTSESKAC